MVFFKLTDGNRMIILSREGDRLPSQKQLRDAFPELGGFNPEAAGFRATCELLLTYLLAKEGPRLNRIESLAELLRAVGFRRMDCYDSFDIN